LVAYYRRHWLATAMPFLAGVVPADVSRQVLYPFGGGDLMSALATFPSAETITSVSLEPSGDARRPAQLDTAGWTEALADVRLNLQHLFAVSHSKTVNLRRGAKAALPAEVAFALVALSLHGQEPVGLRYFRWGPNGQINYLPERDNDPGLGGPPEDKAFAHVEISFRPRAPATPGGEAAAALRFYRHIAANLDDAHFKEDPGLGLLLTGAGPSAALIKAASYLLWSPAFSRIRDFLASHADWMISDSTGLPPSVAEAAGLSQEVWGQFHGTFFPANALRTREMVALWQAAPLRPLPMMFGYPDNDGHPHMMVTRRAAVEASAPRLPPPRDYPAGGIHWRFVTPRGPVHVWQPRNLDAAHAGLVVYVHGLFTNVDQAFNEHHLAEQFAASRLNAVFVVPEAPVASDEEVHWASLPALRAAVEQALPGLPLQGPLALVGHSGAYRTLACWLDEPGVNALMLLDAFYGQEERFASWLERAEKEPGPHLTVVTRDTTKLANAFLARHPEAVRLPRVPRRWEDLDDRAQTAPVLELHAQWNHMGVVTSGRVLPLVLRRAPIPLLPAALRAPTPVLQSSSRTPAPRPPSTATTLPVM